MTGRRTVSLEVNDQRYQVEVEPHRTLLEVLREDLSLTGTKPNCEAGECGACTVLLDGRAINACLFLVVRADEREITTVEGLAEGDRLHPLQEAFLQNAAVQCGYCTPGFLMSAAAVLRGNPNPTEEEFREAVVGNLCRCTGYAGISQALRALAESGQGSG